MNVLDILTLNDLKVFCPPEIVAKYNHKHNNPNDWSRFYYYRDKKKTLVGKQNIEYDYEVSSTLAYNQNIFYKMTALSCDDLHFDYYFKLKNDLPKCIVKKSNRYNKKSKNETATSYTRIERNKIETSKDGKFILRFD